jgi:hypothetical protein
MGDIICVDSRVDYRQDRQTDPGGDRLPAGC